VVGDPNRQPREGDRSPVRDRIKRAVADGLISAADADIRLRNVDMAQSSGELDLIVRDLDQLERAVGPSTATYTRPAAFTRTDDTTGSRRSVWIAAVVAVVLGALVLGGVGLFAFSGGSDSDSATELGEPQPIASGNTKPADEPTDEPVEASPSAPGYSLSAAGVRSFIATYRQRFGSTRVVTATFYGDYVVVQVPVAGRNRHSGWVYRPGSGFSDFGGISANFPGSSTVDLRRLDVPALFANLSRAKRVLHVSNANQAYVNIDYRPQFDPAPNVNIYLSNEFNESGYLATRLDGSVERAYPYSG